MTTRALLLALRPSGDPASDADLLLRVAGGNRGAVRLALRRVRGDGGPASRVADRAAGLLRLALAKSA